jgi:hypothetical protein
MNTAAAKIMPETRPVAKIKREEEEDDDDEEEDMACELGRD